MTTPESGAGDAIPRAPEPTLEWETRTPRQSRLSKLFRPAAAATQARDPEAVPAATAPQNHSTALARKEAGPHASHASLSARARARLDAILPPHRKYLGMRRPIFLAAAAAASVALLILIVGLAAGLSARSGGSAKMPLPESGGADGKTYSGDLTFYNPGLGACGGDHGDGDMVVAVSHGLFDEASAGNKNPNANPLCGRKIRVSVDGADDSVEVTVVDRCEGCQPTDLDMSPAAFGRIADKNDGRVKGKWQWV